MKNDEDMLIDAQIGGVSTIPSKPTKIQGNTGRNGKPLPPNAGKGRPKGSPNKTTKTLREAITQAFDDLGGAAWVKKLAEEDTRAFVMLLAKVIPPAPKDIDELVGLAERMAEARARIEQKNKEEWDEISRLSDEELICRMEKHVKEWRDGGSSGGDVLLRGVRTALARPKTLEDLLEGSWGPDSPVTVSVPRADVSAPELPEPVKPIRGPAPFVPVMPPLPGVKPAPSPRQSTDEQLPGQAVNSHRRALADDYTSPRSGRCITREWEE